MNSGNIPVIVFRTAVTFWSWSLEFNLWNLKLQFEFLNYESYVLQYHVL